MRAYCVVTDVGMPIAPRTHRQGWTGEMDFIDGIRISAEDMRKTLLGGDAAVLVAKHKERLAGCIKVEQLDSGEAEVGMFAVDPDFQSCGVGSALLDAAHDFAEEVLDAKETCMMVLDNRLDIIAWYKQRGYVATDETVLSSHARLRLPHGPHGPCSWPSCPPCPCPPCSCPPCPSLSCPCLSCPCLYARSQGCRVPECVCCTAAAAQEV
jgi:GNAT superfamily N-acetyltransferase